MSKTGPKRAPRALKLVEGTRPGRDSGGRKIADPLPLAPGAPDKPDDLSPEAAAFWDRLVPALAEAGVLRRVDASALTVAAETWARWRSAVAQRQAQGMTARTSQGESTAPWVGIEERAARDLRGWFSEYGLTPAAAAALTPAAKTPDDDDNPFA
ncbi:phage terminase small subunit P27 family [Kocuria rosea]|uniref:phage terminase small subunit P27 family n=1 Tax=Kocuria rosea TaxID=1275 RepID=UPI000D65DF1C|nr:phage terminase small subunit P27 family [Kocuria rosea]PWF88689.1 phage terminase small subunit P27 family [Kocuria rosea]STX02474.1 Phage terminase, small subunit [Kocuria rosea]